VSFEECREWPFGMSFEEWREEWPFDIGADAR
jgi:hypothetical protein